MRRLFEGGAYSSKNGTFDIQVKSTLFHTAVKRRERAQFPPKRSLNKVRFEAQSKDSRWKFKLHTSHITRKFTNGHPQRLPACNFLSQYYFYNIFPQKSCRAFHTKFKGAKTGSGVGFLCLTAVRLYSLYKRGT